MKNHAVFCLFAAALAGLSASAEVPYKLGIAGYTFCKAKLDKGLEICQKVNCHYLCHKDFFLSYDATDAEIAAYKAKLATYGVETVASGPFYANDEATLRRQFAFAKRFGLKTIVGVPFAFEADGKTRVESDAILDAVEKLVKEYDIRYAIHNHGPDIPKLFPSAAAVWKRIERRDRRIGLCLDVAHDMRTGADPVADIRAYGSRIYDVHLHNVEGGTPKFVPVRTPYGALDTPAVMKALAECGFDGVAHIEYSRDFDDNLVGLAESMGYYLGCMASVRVKAWLEPVPEGANTLTAAEKADGWELLWDGKGVPDKWVGEGEWKFERFPSKGWCWANGELWMRPVHAIQDGKWIDLPPEDKKLGGGGSIQTRKFYRDFHFKVDFKLTEAANSGIKYFFNEKLNSSSCEEYQLLDNGHPDYSAAGGKHRIGTLYDLMLAPQAERACRPLGRWNTAEVVSKGRHVEHWLNGVKILEYERGGAAFRAAVAKSKYATWGKDAAGRPQPWGELPEGRIHLQDHTDSTVYFCNIKIKEL